jgi:hypothetical protein
MAFLGVLPYVYVVTHSCPETHKTKISLNLKAIALSGSERDLYVMLNCCNAYAYVTRYPRSFCTTVRCHEPLFKAMLTEGLSFYAYRIYIRKFSDIFPLAMTATYFSQ